MASSLLLLVHRPFADIIDDFLLVADKNNDGYLNFNEYKETLRGSTDHELGAGDHPGDTHNEENDNNHI